MQSQALYQQRLGWQECDGGAEAIYAVDTESESVQSRDSESVTEIRRTQRNSFIHIHIRTESGANVTVGFKRF